MGPHAWERFWILDYFGVARVRGQGETILCGVGRTGRARDS
jgi:hypothetical protein